jgi:hypothetical protein
MGRGFYGVQRPLIGGVRLDLIDARGHFKSTVSISYYQFAQSVYLCELWLHRLPRRLSRHWVDFFFFCGDLWLTQLRAI